MQVQGTSFAQTYQQISPTQPMVDKVQSATPEQRNNTADAALDKRNELQQSQENNEDQKRSAITSIAGYQQTQNNYDTYTQSYQNATGGSSTSSSSSNLSYSDIQDMNETINRYQVSNSDMLSNYIDRQQEEKPTTYNQMGIQAQQQIGSTINAYA